MKKILLIACALVSFAMLHAQPKVYMTKEISPESLVRIYKALGVPAQTPWHSTKLALTLCSIIRGNLAMTRNHS